MSLYTDVINQERKKIKLLESRIDDCRKRIKLLESMGADDVDDLLEKQIKGVLSQNNKRDEKNAPTKRATKMTDKLLSLLLDGQKTIDQMYDLCAAKGINSTRGNLRTHMMNLRVRHGFVENPSKGIYEITDIGRDRLREIDEKHNSIIKPDAQTNNQFYAGVDIKQDKSELPAFLREINS